MRKEIQKSDFEIVVKKFFCQSRKKERKTFFGRLNFDHSENEWRRSNLKFRTFVLLLFSSFERKKRGSGRKKNLAFLIFPTELIDSFVARKKKKRGRET